VSVLTPPARHIDPRGQRFGAGVSVLVLLVALVLGLPWLALLVGLNLGLSAAFGTRLFLPGRLARRAPRAAPGSTRRARARVPAALRAGARRLVHRARRHRLPRRRHAGRLAAGRGRGDPPGPARRHRDLRRLPPLCPALVGADAVRAPIPPHGPAPPPSRFRADPIQRRLRGPGDRRSGAHDFTPQLVPPPPTGSSPSLTVATGWGQMAQTTRAIIRFSDGQVRSRAARGERRAAPRSIVRARDTGYRCGSDRSSRCLMAGPRCADGCACNGRHVVAESIEASCRYADHRHARPASGRPRSSGAPPPQRSGSAAGVGIAHRNERPRLLVGTLRRGSAGRDGKLDGRPRNGIDRERPNAPPCRHHSTELTGSLDHNAFGQSGWAVRNEPWFPISPHRPRLFSSRRLVTRVVSPPVARVRRPDVIDQGPE